MSGALRPRRPDTEVGETLRQKAGQEPPGVWDDEGAEEAETGLAWSWERRPWAAAGQVAGRLAWGLNIPGGGGTPQARAPETIYLPPTLRFPGPTYTRWGGAAC